MKFNPIQCTWKSEGGGWGVGGGVRIYPPQILLFINSVRDKREPEYLASLEK